MQVQFNEINLKAQLGDPEYIKSQTDLVIGQLMNNIDILTNAKYENEDFFGCSVTLGDLDFNLNLDFFLISYLKSGLVEYTTFNRLFQSFIGGSY